MKPCRLSVHTSVLGLCLKAVFVSVKRMKLMPSITVLEIYLKSWWMRPFPSSGFYPHKKHRTKLSMGMQHHIEVRQEKTKTLNSESQPCFEDATKSVNLSFTTANENYRMWKVFAYTKEDCESAAIAQYFAEKCRCIPLGRYNSRIFKMPWSSTKCLYQFQAPCRHSTYFYSHCGNLTNVDREDFLQKWHCFQAGKDNNAKIETCDTLFENSKMQLKSYQ